MKEVPLGDIQGNLAHYVEEATHEAILIMCDGVPAGILLGLDAGDDWWETLLLHTPALS